MDIKLTKTTLYFEGFIFTILGILAIVLPAATTFSIAILIGILLIIVGVIQMIRVFQNRESPSSFWISLISAILAIVLGILILVFPMHGVMVLTMLLGIWFLVHGVIEIALGFRARHVSKGWGFMVFSGLISIILAIIIWATWPVSALWFIGLLLGINLLLFGLSLFALAYRLNQFQTNA